MASGVKRSANYRRFKTLLEDFEGAVRADEVSGIGDPSEIGSKRRHYNLRRLMLENFVTSLIQLTEDMLRASS